MNENAPILLTRFHWLIRFKVISCEGSLAQPSFNIKGRIMSSSAIKFTRL
ncbi:MAG: hypothetical protein QOD00_2899 [Blastocatellia bacterium]|nr:hypothetical protein [Blastocatellia bacterium]